MKKSLAALIFMLISFSSANAGFIDIFNGVKLGAQIPAYNFQYLTEAPDTNGKLLLIDFWATWCQPCRKAIPKLNAWHDKFTEQGLLVIGVSQETKEIVQPFVAEIPMSYPHAIEGAQNLHKALGIRGLPYSIFVTPSGKIIWRGQPSEITDELITSLLATHKGG